MKSDDYSQHALFMDTLPADLSSDVTLSALQAIDEEELRSLKDSALHWKTIGNDHFQEGLAGRKRRFLDAIDAYSRGLSYFDKFGPRETFKPDETALRCQLYTNRANAQLKAGLYVESIDDCRQAIALDSHCVKAHYHAARASQGLGLFQQCMDFCDKSFEYDSSRSLQGLRDEMDRKLSHMRAIKDAEKTARTLAESKCRLAEILRRERHIDYMDTTRFDVPGLTDTSRARVVREGPPAEIEWPILFLIEKYGVCDFAAQFNDKEPLMDLLGVMFPGEGRFAEWDKEQTFEYDNVDCFFEEDHGRSVDDELKIDLWKPFREEVQKISFVYKFIVIVVKEKPLIEQ